MLGEIQALRLRTTSLRHWYWGLEPLSMKREPYEASVVPGPVLLALPGWG